MCTYLVMNFICIGWLELYEDESEYMGEMKIYMNSFLNLYKYIE